ncbi:MAG: glycosyltransferase [Bauldia sp.]
MRINILDPALRSSAGHHLEFDRITAEEMRARGHTVCVVGNLDCEEKTSRRFPPEVRHLRLFRTRPYQVGRGRFRFAGSFAAYLYAARMIANDLKSVPPADMWIWPTLFAHDLRACGLARAEVPISGVIHRASLDGTWSMTTQLIWRDAARLALRHGLDIRRIGPIEDEMLPELAGALARFSPMTLPVPVEASGTPVRRMRLETVGFFGHQSGTYRIDAVGKLAEACANAGLKVIVQDSSERLKPSLRPEIRQVGYVDDLAALVQQADLAILPYAPGTYRTALSGIGAVAIACGVPVLAPAETSIARKLARYNTGLTFADDTAAGVLAAIDTVRADYAAFADRARRAAEVWAVSNNVAGYADALLGKR